MCNLHQDPRTSEGSLTLLHKVCGIHSTSSEGRPPDDLHLVQVAVELAADVDAQQKHIFKADALDVKDYERPCCILPGSSCLAKYRDASACICLKFSNLYYMPLHVVVLHACQYPSCRACYRIPRHSWDVLGRSNQLVLVILPGIKSW